MRHTFLLCSVLLASGCGGEPNRDEATDSGVLTQATALLNSDRPWSAARLLHDAEIDDPDLRLIAARAEARIGNWERVRDLLGGARGLDSMGGEWAMYLTARALDETGDVEAALVAYDAFLSAVDDSELRYQEGGARLRRALLLVQIDPEVGNRALSEIPNLSLDWRTVLEAEALARAGHADRVEVVASRFAAGALGQRAWSARIEAARQTGDLGRARDLARQARAQADTDDARAEFALVASRLASEAGERAAARALLRDAIEVAPGSAAAREAAALLRQGEKTAEDWLALAWTDRALGLNTDASGAFQQWLRAGVGTPEQQATVRYQAADALFDAQRYDEVEAVLAPIRERADARELWAGTLSRMGRTEDAAAVYLDLASGDPAPNLYFAADALHQGGNVVRALPLYRQVEREHPGTRWAGLATMRRAGQAFLDADYAEAARLWEGYRSRQPTGRHALRSRFWAGRALAEAGDARGAEAHFRGVLQEARDSYYALLASEALGESFWPLPMTPSPPEDPAAASGVRDALRGVDVLREAGFEDAAEAELDRAITRVGGGVAVRYALAEALIERGYGRRAILIGQGLSGGTNERRMRILYPFPFRRMIAAEAEANGVDPFTAAALIRQESQFSAHATSPVGARGLMQLMPATAQTLVEAGGIENWNPEWLYLPEINVHLGTRYVGEQATAYGGALSPIFGAYNAGPHQIDAWRSFPEYGRDALFTERIPFRETRDYVKILTRNRAIYEGLYGTP